MASIHLDFMSWAAAYDSAGLEQRSRVEHEAWLDAQAAPIMRLDSARSVADLVDGVIKAVADLRLAQP